MKASDEMTVSKPFSIEIPIALSTVLTLEAQMWVALDLQGVSVCLVCIFPQADSLG